MDLNIKIDKRNRGLFHHRMPRIGAKKVKKQASCDILKECGPDKFYSINYINQESLVLSLINYTEEIIII